MNDQEFRIGGVAEAFCDGFGLCEIRRLAPNSTTKANANLGKLMDGPQRESERVTQQTSSEFCECEISRRA